MPMQPCPAAVALFSMQSLRLCLIICHSNALRLSFAYHLQCQCFEVVDEMFEVVDAKLEALHVVLEAAPGVIEANAVKAPLNVGS